MNINDAIAVIKEQIKPDSDLGEPDSIAILARVQQAFKDFPELKKDSKLMKEIYDFSVERGDSKTAEVGREFIFSCLKSQEDGIEIFEDLSYLSNNDRNRMIRDLRTSPNRFDAKRGVLVLSEEKLISSDQLWNFVEKHPVKELIVWSESGSFIAYNSYMLDELVEKRPDIKALTEMITVKFGLQPELDRELPRAKLMLCGDFFDAALAGRWNEKEIDLYKVYPESFHIILDIIETGKFEPSLLHYKRFIDACDFLFFSPPIPENAVGPDQWMEHFGDVGEVPPLPSDLEVGENQLLVLIPKTVNGKPYCLNELKRLLDNKVDPAMKFLRYNGCIQEEDGDVSPTKSHWVVMDKGVMEGSLNLSRDHQKEMVERKGCRLPKVLEAATAIFMHYAVTGERIFNSSRYTCCEELEEGYKTVVGEFCESGLSICSTVGRRRNVGVAALREV